MKEEVASSFEPKIVELAPIGEDGIQTKQILSNPKRYGFVVVEVDGGVKFHNAVDLISLLSIRADQTIGHFFNPILQK